MKSLSTILKERGMFSKDIKQRIASGQIKINDEVVIKDVEFDIVTDIVKEEEVDKIWDAGDWIFNTIKESNVLKHKMQIFGLSHVLENDLTKFKFLRLSKKQMFVFEIK